MENDAVRKRERRMKKYFLLLVTTLFFVSLSQIVSAQMAAIVITGTVSGPCAANASINATGYNQTAYDPNKVVWQANSTANGAGDYGVGLQYPSSLYSGLTVVLVATNPSCDSRAIGNRTDYMNNGGSPYSGIDITMSISIPLSLSSPADGAAVSTNQPTFTWTDDGGNYYFDLVIDDNSNFGSPYRNITIYDDTNHTLNDSAQTLADGTYYWKVDLRLTSGGQIVTTSSSRSFTVGAAGPAITGFYPSNSTWKSPYTSGNFIQAYADKEGTCKMDKYEGTAFSAMTYALTAYGNQSFYYGGIPSPAQGYTNYTIRCNSSLGVMGEEYTFKVRYDSVPPIAGGAVLTIDGGAAYHLSSSPLSLSWTVFTDPSPGIQTIGSYYYSLENNWGTTGGTSTTGTSGSLSGFGEGTVRAYVWAQDSLGNIGGSINGDIIVDLNPPTFSTWTYVPSDLTKYTSGNFTVRVSITDTSGISGQPQLRYRIGSDAWSSWYNMSIYSGSVYYYSIAEGASPNDWEGRQGETLYINVTAMDIHNRSNSALVTDFIDNSSASPVFQTNLSNITLYQGNSTSFNVSATDLDADNLEFSSNWTSLSVTQINNSLATFSYTATSADVGTRSVRISVTDGTFYTNQTIWITVLNINDPPVLSSIGSLAAYEYEYFNYTLNASDDDGDTLTYSANTTLFAVNSRTGEIGFTPTRAQRGQYVINFTVTDGQGGIDDETITFTVGYCGDESCNANFESCSICEIDCDVCGETESGGIILLPRNCLNRTMEFQVAKLVHRTRCPEEGMILDNMEVCGNLSNEEISIQKKINGTFTEVATIVSDENGYASYFAEEDGDYKLAFTGGKYTTHYKLFSINPCIEDLKDEASPSESGSNPVQPSKLPELEEPSPLQELTQNTMRWTLLLSLLILILIGGTSYGMHEYYRNEKIKNPNSKYVKIVDTSILQAVTYKNKLLQFLSTNKYTKPLFDYTLSAYRQVKAFVLKYYKKYLEKHVNIALVYLTKQKTEFMDLIMMKNIKVPFYSFPNLSPVRKTQLIVVSIIKHFNKKWDMSSILDIVERQQLLSGDGSTSLLDITNFSITAGLKVRFAEAVVTNVAVLNNMINAGLTYEQRAYGIVDLQFALNEGKVPLVELNYDLLKNPNATQYYPTNKHPVIVTGFKKNVMFINDYTNNLEARAIDKSVFIKAWKMAGQKTVIVFK